MKTLKTLIGMVLALATVAGVQAQQTDLRLAASLPALKLMQPTVNNPYVLVLGWASANDGGGGVYKATTSAVSTNYGAVASTINSARQWIRLPAFGFDTSAPRTQTIGADSNIVAEASVIKVTGAGGTVTNVASPTISITGVVDGQVLRIIGGANTLQLDDEGTTAGTALKLGAASRALSLDDVLTLKYNLATTNWCEVAFVNN